MTRMLLRCPRRFPIAYSHIYIPTLHLLNQPKPTSHRSVEESPLIRRNFAIARFVVYYGRLFWVVFEPFNTNPLGMQARRQMFTAYLPCMPARLGTSMHLNCIALL